MLSARDLFELRRAGLPVCVPAGLGSSFVVDGIEAEMDAEWGGSYRIVFRGPGGQWVMVEAAAGGVGDVFPGASTEEFTHPVFGESAVEFYDPGSEPVDFRSRWMRGDQEFPVFSVAGGGLSVSDAVYLARSLQVVDA
ncbi:MAG: hypothetical protein FJX76_04020 [Armatimonadetes bacterium]|nr:hypothetical protein [Armatimonadota bacterium]